MSDTVCTNCSAGYGLQNNECATCPAGTYLDGQNCVSKESYFEWIIEGKFLACTNNCATCTSATICESCTAGYGFQGTSCATCPVGTYLVSQTCTSKKKFLFIES